MDTKKLDPSFLFFAFKFKLQSEEVSKECLSVIGKAKEKNVEID